MASGSNRDNTLVDDEFSQAAGTPGGAHRGRKGLAVRLRPYIIVVAVAACLGILLWMWVSGTFSGHPTTSYTKAAASVSSSPSASSKESTSGNSAGSGSSSPSASNSSGPSSSSGSQEADKGTQIIIYNGGHTKGLAASKQAQLTQAGYTHVSAMNPANRSVLPSQQTVWYKAESDKAAAQAVAQQLGISSVSQRANIAAPVVVIVR